MLILLSASKLGDFKTIKYKMLTLFPVCFSLFRYCVVKLPERELIPMLTE